MGQTPYPVLLTTRWGIHTFFMKDSIDVVILDPKNHISVLKRSLKPWRMFVWNPMLETVLELPKGTIDKLDLKKGDAVKVSYK